MLIPKKKSFQDPLSHRRGQKDDLEIDIHCFLTTAMRSRVRSQTVNTQLQNKRLESILCGKLAPESTARKPKYRLRGTKETRKHIKVYYAANGLMSEAGIPYQENQRAGTMLIDLGIVMDDLYVLVETIRSEPDRTQRNYRVQL